MDEMTTPKNSKGEGEAQFEYQYVEYETEHETVAIIQDTGNQSAWVQSTVSTPVER